MANYIEKIEKGRYPVCTTTGVVLFPGMSMDLDIKFKPCFDACKRALEKDALVFLVSYKKPLSSPADMEIRSETIQAVGTLARITQALTPPDMPPRLVVRGVSRARILSLIPIPDGSTDAEVLETSILMNPDSPRAHAALKAMQDSLEAYCAVLAQPLPDTLKSAVSTFRDPALLADFLIANLVYLPEIKQQMLEIFDPLARVGELVAWMASEHDRILEENEIREKVQARLDGNQREYRLREQIRVLREELGESEEEDDEEILEYRKKLAEATLPDEVRVKLAKEISKLAKTPYASAESTVIRQYLDICLEVPWSRYSKERRNVSAAARLLDKDHSGMEKVKERILEFIAVRARNPQLKNQILCLIGAPGTGKTSVSASIAKALNRNFVRVCLGGIRDEAEIRGHRKTYIGAMPGRIVTALRQAEVMNPVILLDELDKMSSDAHGDPAAAMLEVLDAEQNCRFRDHFLEMPIDLSDCIFIATANSRSSIPAPLIDRMEFIDLPPYLPTEKLHIAKEHLLPKQMERHGLNKKVLRVADEALIRIIDEYTKEAGVRGLERELATLCRKVAKRLVEEKTDSLIRIDAAAVPTLLGPSKIIAEQISDTDEVGIVNGMAWTETGGTLLRVEVMALPGDGKLKLTGSLGDVMKESAQLAVSFCRAHAATYGIDPDFYKKLDLHIHLPEGAVPKDGPSAGITLTTAILSELTHRAVRRDVAMTGEISLHGKLLPIGGLREKATAAYYAGVKTVLIPKGNEADLQDIPSEIREAMTFLPLCCFDEVPPLVLLPSTTETEALS